MVLRRTPLKRGSKPLRRHRPLVARKPMRAARPRPAVPAVRKVTLVERSAGWCEAQLVGCLGRATDAHHRITQKMGGRHGEAKERHDRLPDLLHLCRTCHGWIGARPAEAKEMGLALEEWQIPAQEPVVYRGEVSYLTDDGRVLSFEEVGV